MAIKKSKKTYGAKLAADIQKSRGETAVLEKEPTKAPKTAKAAKEPKGSKHYVVIDYPIDAETVSGLHYAIRIGASETGSVEISFDNGEWLPARNSAGYWWYDWGYFTAGKHTMAVRLRNEAGKTLKKSEVRTVDVV